MTTHAKPSPTSDATIDRALVALSIVVFALSIALQDWVQAATVATLFVVAATKLRDPHAAWLTWTPRVARR